jgi:hypothetical protein
MIEKNERENLGLLKEKYKETFSDVTFDGEVVSFSFLDLKIADDFYEETLKKGFKSIFSFKPGSYPKVDIDITGVDSFLEPITYIIDYVNDWQSRIERFADKEIYYVANPSDDFINSLPKKTWQGVPSIAVTKKGRLFICIYTGGESEPHPDNYTALYYSDDNGKSWSKPVFITYSNRETCVQTIDLQAFINKEGKLQLFWAQRDYLKNKRFVNNYGCYFYDESYSCFTCEIIDPDAQVLEFTTPVFMSKGLCRNKPIELTDGSTLYFAYESSSNNYCMTKTFDGKNFERITGGKKLPTLFDESMGYELKDGSIKMYARTSVDCLAQSVSYDKGKTWTDGERTEILNANSRFYIGRTPSGKILLINNDQKNTAKHERSNLTVYLSDDDGKTFKYKKMLDDRVGVSYPDVDFYDGKIYVIYDRGRDIENKLVLSIFTEEEITAENFNPSKKYVLDI